MVRNKIALIMQCNTIANRWPSIIYDPLRVSRKLQSKLIKQVGKKHIIYYYGSANYDVASVSQMKPFLEHKDEFSKQSVKKNDLAQFNEGIAIAESEILLPAPERVSWNHPVRIVKQKKKPLSMSPRSKQSAPEPSASETKKTGSSNEKKDNKAKQNVPKAKSKAEVSNRNQVEDEEEEWDENKEDEDGEADDGNGDEEEEEAYEEVGQLIIYYSL